MTPTMSATMIIIDIAQTALLAVSFSTDINYLHYLGPLLVDAAALN